MILKPGVDWTWAPTLRSRPSLQALTFLHITISSTIPLTLLTYQEDTNIHVRTIHLFNEAADAIAFAAADIALHYNDRHQQMSIEPGDMASFSSEYLVATISWDCQVKGNGCRLIQQRRQIQTILRYAL